MEPAAAPGESAAEAPGGAVAAPAMAPAGGPVTAAHPTVRADITEAPIDTAGVLADVEHPSHGAAILFLGVVRDHNEGRAVDGIQYEAYREMAEEELRRIAGDCLEARAAGARRSAEADPPSSVRGEEAPGPRVSLVHRIGELAVGEVSLAVAVSTPHRGDAYELSRTILEALKRRLPVWKKERYADGAVEWLDGVASESPA
jgi:molybdopterin synthase catalytic subunit